MDIQKEHSIFAETIARELIDELTGDNINYLSGKVPEEKFIVGQLSPKAESMEFLSSRTIINSVGLNFNIEKEKLNDCELIIHLCGNLFYRVFPPYEEQCQAMVQEYNKMFGKSFFTLEEFLKDDTLKDQFWDEKKAKPNPDCKLSMLNAYRKISLEDYGIYVSIKLSDIYDQEHSIGVVDDSSAVNGQLTKTINDIIENFVLNQEDYYSYEVREKISIYDMNSRNSWENFLEKLAA